MKRLALERPGEAEDPAADVADLSVHTPYPWISE